MKNIIYTVFALSIMGLSACSQKEDITSPLVGQAINASFSVGGAQTRVNTLDEHADKWENGDMIKAKVTGGGKTSESVLTATVSVSEDGSSITSWSHHKNFVWQDNGKHKVYVSYPSDYVCDENGKWTLPEDQSTFERLKGADFIDGKYEGGPQYGIISILAEHRLAMVTVTYEIGTADFAEGTTLENPVVKSPFAKFSSTGDGVSGAIGSGVVEVKAYVHEGENKFSAIIVPGKINVDSEFLSFSVGKKKYVSKLKLSTDFEGGTCYTYSLKVGKNKVELTQIKVDDFPDGWTTEEELK